MPRDSVEQRARGAERLVDCVTSLSHARSLDDVVDIVRRGARDLVGADGATFVLREGDLCHYVDEDAIGPLWKGRRFPMTACVSGWAMINRQSVAIPDVFADGRVPADAYRSTFVKSLVMVPIRRTDPIGAIGAYWAEERAADDEEIRLLQALADITSVTLDNVALYRDLELRVDRRTQELREANARLAAANEELDSFAGAVAHDLRSPLSGLLGSADLLGRTEGVKQDPRAARYVERQLAAARRMNSTLDALLGLSRASQVTLQRVTVDVEAIARAVGANLAALDPEASTVVRVAPMPTATADEGLVRVILENIMGNAWKYTRASPEARIHVGAEPVGGETVYFVQDNGPGLGGTDPEQLFRPFQRGNGVQGIAGHGLGLPTVRRAVERHGGRVWAESLAGGGARFCFTLE